MKKPKPFALGSLEPKAAADGRFKFPNGDLWEFTGDQKSKTLTLNAPGRYTLAKTGTIYSGTFVRGLHCVHVDPASALAVDPAFAWRAGRINGMGEARQAHFVLQH